MLLQQYSLQQSNSQQQGQQTAGHSTAPLNYFISRPPGGSSYSPGKSAFILSLCSVIIIFI